MDEQGRRLDEIRIRLAERRLLLFVGADADPAISGVPNRQKLADGLALRMQLPPGPSLAEVAQQVMTQGNRWVFTDYLRGQLPPAAAATPPAPLFGALAALVQQSRPEVVITTAYHNRLEAALESLSGPVDVVMRDNLLAFANPDRTLLLKLYGDIGQVESLVVTEQDQNALLRGRRNPEMVEEVRRAMRRSTIFFVAHNLRDPVTTVFFDEVTGGRFQSPSYALWPGLRASEKEAWRSNRNLTVWEDEPVDFLRALAE